MLSIFCLSACSSEHQGEVDELNLKAYTFHYRHLDSVEHYARKAYQLATHYSAGRAEALNHLAFIQIARMDFDRAYELLDSIDTDNQVELLIADVQRMRLCQRQSNNRDFYIHRERAIQRLRRIDEDRSQLSPHLQRRVEYATSEMNIVASVYFYYLGLKQASINAISHIDPNTEVQQDTAQLLNYYYNVGSGGIVERPTHQETAQVEFDYLMRCYLLASQHDYPYFVAQSLQSISEHLNDPTLRDELMDFNLPAMKFINTDNMPDSLLAGNLAQRALNIFSQFGDVYQIAGAYRTLAECFWEIGDYASAEICLQNALRRDPIINRAPDLVASIREQLSLVYSAVDNKQQSDINRNIYLDMQERTRQDRQLEARAEQLSASVRQLNYMILAVVLTILLLAVSLYFFAFLRRKEDGKYSADSLLEPLRRWKSDEEKRNEEELEHYEQLQEEIETTRLHVLENRKRNLEQRAKLTVVGNVRSLIDRILHEVKLLRSSQVSKEEQREHFSYMEELTDTINQYNDMLTRWIQMRRGEVSLHIESFPLQELFDTINKGKMSFYLKGIQYDVKPTKDIVKADKALTLFMLNTLADNARKFTPAGGQVTVSSHASEEYVEIAVEDTGNGMTPEQLQHLFDYKPLHDQTQNTHQLRSHGYGLMNCKGIIEKYRKTSHIFHVCSLSAESEQGKGTRIKFRLPKGMRRTLQVILLLLTLTTEMAANEATITSKSSPSTVNTTTAQQILQTAKSLADSAYFCNINGNYQLTMSYADSCTTCLDTYIALKHHPDTLYYEVKLDIHNEAAVASLALHNWNSYHQHNKIYTQLFREISADKTLDSYCREMERSETNRAIAVAVLLILLLLLVPAYYILYYRHRLYYRYSLEQVSSINQILLSSDSPQEKLTKIRQQWTNSSASSYDDRFKRLDTIVAQICQALESSIETESKQQVDIELAEDNLKRYRYENDKLYVTNSILDNCLSTLKHETMYYPSRISQLISPAAVAAEAPPTTSKLDAVQEVVVYYRELYGILSTQAFRLVEDTLHIDRELMQHLFDILRRINQGEAPHVKPIEKNEKYVTLSVEMEKLSLTHDECRKLFTPLTIDVQFLVCSQLIRELNEHESARACGIQASLRPAPTSESSPRAEAETPPVIIDITITKNIWNSLKSSL